MNYFAFIFSVPPIGYKVWCFSTLYHIGYNKKVVANIGDIGDRVHLFLLFDQIICIVKKGISKHTYFLFSYVLPKLIINPICNAG